MSDQDKDLDKDDIDTDIDDDQDPAEPEPSKNGDDTVDEDDPEAVKAAWRKAQAEKAELETKNRRLYERVKKSRTSKSSPQTPSKELSEKVDNISNSVSELKLIESKRRFGFEHGLSPEETDAVYRINPNPSKDTLEDPFVKGGLEAIRAKARIAGNTPRGGSSRSRQVNGKNFHEMDAKERKENYDQLMSQRLRKDE